MKRLFMLSILSLSSLTWAAQGWKVVAVTTNCKDKLEVLAKDGEKFVYVVNGEKKTQLFSEDGSTFSQESGSMTTFTNKHDKSAEDKFVFSQPSMVDGNPPKLDIASNSFKDHCRMKMK